MSRRKEIYKRSSCRPKFLIARYKPNAPYYANHVVQYQNFMLRRNRAGIVNDQEKVLFAPVNSPRGSVRSHEQFCTTEEGSPQWHIVANNNSSNTDFPNKTNLSPITSSRPSIVNEDFLTPSLHRAASVQTDSSAASLTSLSDDHGYNDEEFKTPPESYSMSHEQLQLSQLRPTESESISLKERPIYKDHARQPDDSNLMYLLNRWLVMDFKSTPPPIESPGSIDSSLTKMASGSVNKMASNEQIDEVKDPQFDTDKNNSFSRFFNIMHGSIGSISHDGESHTMQSENHSLPRSNHDSDIEPHPVATRNAINQQKSVTCGCFPRRKKQK